MAASSAPRPTPPPSAPSPPPPATPPPEGDLEDRGAVRRESVRARSWRARGAARVVGDVEAGRVDLDGLTTVGGRITVGDLASRGTLEVGGAVLAAGSFAVRGTTRLAAALTAGELAADGLVVVAGPVVVHGAARVGGRLEGRDGFTADRIALEGQMSLAGEVEARSVDGRLRGASSVERIRAERIVLRSAGRLGSPGTLFALRIDAREVDLEGVTCQYVRADRLTIGAGCQLARVDGTILRQHPKARVGPASRSPPPYGLFR